jgi:branched-chain amino acid transport system substrate-binding protein
VSNFPQFVGGSGKADASLSPVTIGWVNMQGGPPSQTFAGATRAAEATVKFINTELGGVHGHPVQLSTCFIAGAPGCDVRETRVDGGAFARLMGR